MIDSLCPGICNPGIFFDIQIIDIDAANNCTFCFSSIVSKSCEKIKLFPD